MKFLTHFLLQRLRHPWIAMGLYLPWVVAMLWLATQCQEYSYATILGLLSLGMFLWTLVEYGLHRFVFHWTEVREPYRSLASGLHRAHHDSADTPELILAPPLSTLVFSSLIFFLLWGITQNLATSLTLEAGLYLGYLAYEWAHYSAHCYKSSSALAQYLKYYHLRHHFKDPSKNFGVTSPLWDYIFKTY